MNSCGAMAQLPSPRVRKVTQGVGDREQAAVGDGDAMSVAAEVGDDLLGAAPAAEASERKRPKGFLA